MKLNRRTFLAIASAVGGSLVLSPVRSAAARPVSVADPVIAPRFPGVAAQQPGLKVDSADAIKALLGYDPATDPDARYFRSRVPVAARIAPFAATQAQPDLSARPQVTNLSQYYEAISDIGDNDFNRHYQYLRYGDTIDPFVTRFQQYQDIVGGWQGAQAVPTTAYTDLLHRTGSLSIGILFQPYTGDDNDGFLQQDRPGHFPVADKLVELAKYFGYDGYFLNVESELDSDQVASLMAFIGYLQQLAAVNHLKTFTVQWYDAVTVNGAYPAYQNTFNSQNAGWITQAGADTIFINYWWGQSDVQTAVRECAFLHLDPISVCYFGLQLERRTGLGITMSPMVPPANNEIDLVIPINGTGAAQASVALFDPARRSLELSQESAAPNPATPGLPDLQSAAYEAELQFWSGGTRNPAVPASPGSYGVANYITERSVIGDLPFFSRFNTGTGTAFYLDGASSSSTPWFSAGIQEILPTWQWWTEDFDTHSTSQLLTVGYDYTTAYNGGTSLGIAGDLSTQNPTAVRLFKTDLKVTHSTQAEVVYRSPKPHAAELYLGLILKDSNRTVWQRLDHRDGVKITAASGGWTRATVPLTRHAGKRVAAISAGVKLTPHQKPVAGYAVNIGSIGIFDPKDRPHRLPRPRHFHIEASHVGTDGSAAELRLLWDFDPQVWYYDITRTRPGGRLIWLGRITGDAYYVQAMPRIGNERSTTVVLKAVGRNPSVDSETSLRFTW
ncbi:hypothetical protein AB0K00_21325 [Dactylosporangium sp. NPDC049525]|uniref:endo-beta-N-acetylglucosaminidase n=1 Tax=Dactylosporangium sp. NPDC049525 TaxID=3154730 RepID=UPI00341B582B